MTRKQLNWGIIGTGYIANRFARNLTDEKIPILGVCARDFEKTQYFAQKYQISHAYKKVSELLANPDIDAIYIGTPNSTHFGFISQSLEAGKHVLCEKPMVINEKQFKQVKELAQKNNLILEEAYTPLHMPLTKTIYEIIDSGKIGKIKLIQATFANRVDHNPQERLMNLALGGGALLDIGCYPLCFALQYINTENLKMASEINSSKTGVDVAGCIQLSNVEQFANLTYSFENTMPKDGIISGEDGYLLIKHFSRANKMRLVMNDGQTIDIKEGNAEKAWLYEVQDFQKYVDNGHDDGELRFSENIIQIMDTIRKSWDLKYPFE